ncbi:hypothetical protein [Pseudomonas gozinkensis]|uniref:hypothetical protein n=1 Tax=Pseudomonas gozinkensis TaxID=2774461 RepID=UPI00178794C6|nr:hypothetical protein [Pseudomonas gozinkensis]
MSFFQGKQKRSVAETAITVSAHTKLSVSKRVDVDTQIVEYEEDTDSGMIAIVSRANTEDYSHRNKKGLVMVFPRDIKSGTYPAKDPQFENIYYFETATIPGYTKSIQYNAVNGSVIIDVVENTAKSLIYKITLDIKVVDDKTNEELNIVGKKDFRAFFEPL